MSIKYLQRTNSWKEHEELHKLFCKCLIKYLQRTNSWEEVLFLLVSFEVPAADQLMENTMATYPMNERKQRSEHRLLTSYFN